MMYHACTRLTVVIIVLLLNHGCDRFDNDEVDEVRKERGVVTTGTLRLTEDAQQAIGLRMTPVDRHSVRRSIRTAGWLITKPGTESVIKAPVTGFFRPRSETSTIVPGTVVESGQKIGTFETFLSPQEQAQLVAAKEEADIAIKQAQVSGEIAAAQLDRLKSGSQMAVAGVRLKELEEIVRKANVAEQEAREKLPFLPQEPYAASLSLKPVDLTAPVSGRVIHVHQAPGQFAIQGDALWTIADWSNLWLRVPVFEGDLPRIKQTAVAEVTVDGDARTLAAKPTSIPQATATGRRTVDLLYEVANENRLLRPGQSVSVSLPIGETVEKLVIPRAAVVWDGMGAACVYVEDGEMAFRRQRVRLGQNVDDTVVVEQGLANGQLVVTVGAQALYGEEFKNQIPLEDDD